MRVASDDGNQVAELAFCDARRLGRIRLRQEPILEPPISKLGFDPLLSLPPQDVYSDLVLKHKSPIKALLLDQSFNAGVGNWVAGWFPIAFIGWNLYRDADEILYHSAVHPERRCHLLEVDELKRLRENTYLVCRTAVDLNADSSQFPSDWLFKHRWVNSRIFYLTLSYTGS